MKDFFLLEKDVCFLNHGSFGACPKPVFEAYQNYQKQIERQPLRFFTKEAAGLLHQSRKKLAQFLNADIESLAFVPNATTAVNIFAQSLNLGKGDEVLSVSHEYGATKRMWKILAGRKGFRYREHKLQVPLENADDFVHRFFEDVGKQTKVIFISHISSPTALILPITEICRKARQAGILTIVDGAHAPGQIPLNLADLECDFYTGNAHKWMLAAKGSAFMYADKSVQEKLKPLIISWGNELPETGLTAMAAEFEYLGTRDISPYLSVSEAIDFLQKYYTPDLLNEKRSLLLKAKQQLEQIFKSPPICSPKFIPMMYAHPLPKNIDGDKLKQILYDNYRIEIPVTQADGHRYLRISVQSYTEKSDIDYLMQSLNESLNLKI